MRRRTAIRRTVLVSAGSCALVVALLSLKPHQSPALAGVAPRTPTSTAPSASSPDTAGKAGGTGTTGTTGGTGTGGKTSKAGKTGKASKAGTYTGDPVGTQYGTVQVAATLTGGRLTGVRVLQAPDQNGRDQQIASYALPRLTQEAVGANSAHIDAVSGASYTSQGYMQSLQSALDKSGA
ncbi:MULTISPECIES: FMN-binding protein [unclassified Streptomyces]|uniref:FMN-binding protein n=1 Tax=unclassified Streptomyces TaxID=2593676 RepID=UPI002E1F5452|nr:FMN-binding protein [Streptomyces sp. NBC_01023]